MEPAVRLLREEHRTSRRTVADALEVLRQELGVEDVGSPHIELGPLPLLSGRCPAIVHVVFPDFGCRVSLPTASRFKARTEISARQEEFEISRLDGAQIGDDGSVLLAEGIRLRAVEVIPERLPREPSELDKQILQHVISINKEDHCYRSIREALPEHFQKCVPDIRLLDYSLVQNINAPSLKEIQGSINNKYPELNVSQQKIADTLAMAGIRVPRRRQRAR